MCWHFSSECPKVRASLPPRLGVVGTNVEKGKKRAFIHKQLPGTSCMYSIVIATVLLSSFYR